MKRNLWTNGYISSGKPRLVPYQRTDPLCRRLRPRSILANSGDRHDTTSSSHDSRPTNRRYTARRHTLVAQDSCSVARMRRPSMPPRWRPSSVPAAARPLRLGQGKGRDERRPPGRRLRWVATTGSTLQFLSGSINSPLWNWLGINRPFIGSFRWSLGSACAAKEGGAELGIDDVDMLCCCGMDCERLWRRSPTSVAPRTRTTINKACFTCQCKSLYRPLRFRRVGCFDSVWFWCGNLGVALRAYERTENF
jgi:hypothetical protein